MKRLSTLELFILSCFDRGLETPYDLQRRAGLSLGATSGALKRLRKAGFLTRQTGRTATKRPRHEYALSDKGREQARNGWRDYLSDEVPPADLDSFLRIFDLAVHYKAPKSDVKEFLNRAIEGRKHAATLLSVAAEQKHGDQLAYPRLRARFEKEHLVTDMNTLAALFQELKSKQRPAMVQGLLLAPTSH